MEEINDPSNTIMPWGKYQGKTFEEIPQSYLEWLLTLNDLKPWLKKKVEEYLSVPPIVRAFNKVKRDEQRK
jgi:hypothetical protein